MSAYESCCAYVGYMSVVCCKKKKKNRVIHTQLSTIDADEFGDDLSITRLCSMFA